MADEVPIATWSRWIPRALTAFVAIPILWIHLTDPGINGFFAAQFHDMIHGTAFQPYVYRALVPWLTRLVVHAIPDDSKMTFVATLSHSDTAQTLLKLGHIDPRDSVECVVASSWMYAALLGFAWATRALFRALYRAPVLVSEVVPLVAILGLPTMFDYCNYVYDLPTLFFFSTALLFLARGRWVAFFVTYCFALFNKETAVLLAAVLLGHGFGRIRVRRFALLAASLGAAFVVSRTVLNHLYSSNLGSYVLPQLAQHNIGLLHSYPPSSFVTAGLLSIFVFGHFREKPTLMKEALFILLPLLGSCLLFGFFDELRDYYEAYPIVVMLIAPSVAQAMGVRVETRTVTEKRVPALAWFRGGGSAELVASQA